MTSVSCSKTSCLKQCGNQFFCQPCDIICCCFDVMMSGYCFVLLFKWNYLTLIWKSAELVVFVPMAISRELFNLLCNSCYPVNSLPTTCRLLITFANSLDPDQAWHSVRPELDPNYLTLWWYSWNNFSKKSILEKKISRRQKKTYKITQKARS